MLPITFSILMSGDIQFQSKTRGKRQGVQRPETSVHIKLLPYYLIVLWFTVKTRVQYRGYDGDDGDDGIGIGIIGIYQSSRRLCSVYFYSSTILQSE